MDIDKSKWPFSFRYPMLWMWMSLAAMVIGYWLIIKAIESYGWLNVAPWLIFFTLCWIGTQMEKGIDALKRYIQYDHEKLENQLDSTKNSASTR